MAKNRSNNAARLFPIVLFPIVLLTGGCSHEAPYQKPITPVRVETVETDKSDEGPSYSGSVEPLSHTDLAFRLGGYVEQILTVPDGRGGTRLVYEGDHVDKGAKLVGLREADYQAKIGQAVSQLDQAKAALTQTEDGVKLATVGRDKAKLDYDRATALFKTQSLTKSDYEGATAQLHAAQATLDQAEAQLPLARARIAGAQALVDEANLGLRDSSIVSPVNGMVLKRMVELGSLVGPGTPAFVLADLSMLKAVFGAPDVLLPHLHLGMTLPLSASATGGVLFNGRITAIAAMADARSRIFDVEVTFPNEHQQLKPGMIVTVHLPASETREAVPVVSMSALVRSKEGAYGVFVVSEQGGNEIAKARAVKLGNALNSRIIVTDGLHAGERIIVSGAQMVSDGETVRIVP